MPKIGTLTFLGKPETVEKKACSDVRHNDPVGTGFKWPFKELQFFTLHTEHWLCFSAPCRIHSQMWLPRFPLYPHFLSPLIPPSVCPSQSQQSDTALCYAWKVTRQSPPREIRKGLENGEHQIKPWQGAISISVSPCSAPLHSILYRL